VLDHVDDARLDAFNASGSCADHSNWLSISRAVVRIAISRTRGAKPASKRR
jgi:hypothetical protein